MEVVNFHRCKLFSISYYNSDEALVVAQISELTFPGSNHCGILSCTRILGHCMVIVYYCLEAVFKKRDLVPQKKKYLNNWILF